MKHYHYFLVLCIIAATLFSCSGQKTAQAEAEVADAGTQTYIFKDSCQHLLFSVSLELPQGTDSVSAQIRDSLIADFVRNVSLPTYGEDAPNPIPSYTGDNEDYKELVNYYGRTSYNHLLELAKSDYEERMKYLEEDTTMSIEEKKRIMSEVPQWAYDLSIKKNTDTERFVVYISQAYTYCGGAHGGMIGSGALTFNMNTGEKVKHFVKHDATMALQSMIRKGLLRYYAEAGEKMTDQELRDRLQIEGRMIPLPQQAAFPNAAGDSLTFTYGQYEIACYADGMPSFTLPVKDLMPYLTSEGKRLLVP